MEQESYPLKSCPHPRRLVQVNIGLWVSFQFFARLAAVWASKTGSFYSPNSNTHSKTLKFEHQIYDNGENNPPK